QRLVRLAAAASRTAAATARLEIYPRDLDPVRALRIAQAGVIPARPHSLPGQQASSDRDRTPRLTVDQVHERVRARFPELAVPVPEHPALDDLLTEAGFAVSWDEVRGGYVLPRGLLSSSGVGSDPTTVGRRRTDVGRVRYAATTPDQAAAVAA
nr:hypothetical protein [Micromonospora sp. DSM 115978]